MREAPRRALIIQTAFLGDAILALPVAQQLRAWRSDAEIHFVVRQDAAPLFANHPSVNRVWVWQKGRGKTRRLLQLARDLRDDRYDLVVNMQRHWGTGFLAAAMRADVKTGFDKNPLSSFYTHRLPHVVSEGRTPGPHEVDRNLSLLAPLGLPLSAEARRPRLYPSPEDYAHVAEWRVRRPYLVMAPASVWFTKQWPAEHWRALIARLRTETPVYLIGGPGDAPLCQAIADGFPNALNLAGKLNLLQSAALLDGAARAVVNDSAPLHLATAMNTPTDALFLSTSPAFGFGPLAEGSQTWAAAGLACQPCGLAGRPACPQGHFRCASGIEVAPLAAKLQAAVDDYAEAAGK